ncbi:MAG: SEC59/DGK1/VTE5 family protein [candidate division Zixibacteria bacterium]|nr:SEC59/DGK1/VTE5 family protein [candidate division Zixibacteria bacterium]MCI0596736.1 SEC59/DGK1/VTE5 family protein [candidate division Zixibacteria bacterium]
MKVRSPSAGGPANIPYGVEVRRKLVHLFSLSIPVGIWYLPETTAVLVLGMAFAGSVIVDGLRHFLPPNARGWRHLTVLFRPKERGKLSGSSFLLLAALILALFFHRETAALSLVFIVVGDVAGALVGRRFGRHPLFDKTWEGSLAFFLACIVFSPFVPGLPFWAKLSSAGVATVVEVLPLKLDDNLTVPLGAAGFLSLILKV